MATVQDVLRRSCLPLISPLTCESTSSDVSDEADCGDVLQPAQTPIAEDANENIPLFYSVSSVVFDLSTQDLDFEVRPLIMDCKEGEHCPLVRWKCRQCMNICDFTDPAHAFAISQKTEILQDLLSAVSSKDIITKLGPQEYEAIFHCFEKNVVRTTSDPPTSWLCQSFLGFESDKIEEVAWDHVRLFYKIIIKFVGNSHFNSKFCLDKVSKLQKQVMSMFRAPDQRERKKARKLFHTIYLVFGHLRRSGRALFTTFLTEFMQLNLPHFGVEEVLGEILSVVNSFTVPLSEHHVTLFQRVILPLHKTKYVRFYHKSLSLVVCAFIMKNNSLALDAVRTISNSWPIVKPVSQVLFLGELENIAQALNPESSREFTEISCKIIKKCICSVNYPVAERALMLWEGPFARFVKYWVSLVAHDVLPVLYKCAKTHWMSHLPTMARKVMMIMKTWNPDDFTNFGQKLTKQKYTEIMKEAETSDTWKNLLMTSDMPEEFVKQQLDLLHKHFLTRSDFQKVQEMYPEMQEVCNANASATMPHLQLCDRLRCGTPHTPVRQGIRVTESRSLKSLKSSMPVRPAAFRSQPKPLVGPFVPRPLIRTAIVK